MSPIHAALLQSLCKPHFLLSRGLCGDDESSKKAIPTLLLSPLGDLENSTLLSPLLKYPFTKKIPQTSSPSLGVLVTGPQNTTPLLCNMNLHTPYASLLLDSKVYNSKTIFFQSLPPLLAFCTLWHLVNYWQMMAE